MKFRKLLYFQFKTVAVLVVVVVENKKNSNF
jgi:hypothetical protein